MKKILLILATITSFTVLIAAPGVALASTGSVVAASTSPKDAVCEGVGLTNGGGGCSTSPGTPDAGSILRTVITIISWAVGIAAIIMIIIGGFKYIISSGDSAKVNSAKDTILYAIIGLVIVAFAQFIVQFVLNKATTPVKSTPPASQSAKKP
jgi:hypothetical protein